MGRKRTDDLGRDTRGTYQRDLGWEDNGKGGFKQHRFYLGKDRAEAAVRSARLGQVWEQVEKRWHRSGRQTARALWDQVTLQIAGSVARGESVCRLDLPERLAWSEVSDSEVVQGATFETANCSPSLLVGWLTRLSADFPMVRLSLADDQAEQDQQQERQQEVQKLEERLGALQQRNTSQTLHGALDAYQTYLGQTYTDAQGKLTQTGQTLVKQIPILQHHISDIPLCDLDLSAIDRWVNYWSKRPVTKRGKPAAPKTCMNLIKRIRHFIRWLHKEPSWSWRKPDDYEVLPSKIKRTPAELAARVHSDQVDTYTDEELGILWSLAHPKERLLMLLALNCGFGIAEISSLQTAEIRLDVASHRKYKTAGHFIMRIRTKSGVYGEWQLWQQTADAIRWYLSVRPKSSAGHLLLRKDGSPLAEQTSGGNKAQGIPNAWATLLIRVRKNHKDFRRLSYNKLRKTAINAIREIAGGETSGIFACHGHPVPSDTMLDLYSNRDFQKVHSACMSWGERLASAFSGEQIKVKRIFKDRASSLKMRGRVVELRQQGKTLKEIGAEVGLSINTVRYHLNRAGTGGDS